MKIQIILVVLVFATLQAAAQVTYEDNDPGANMPLGYLGWNDNQNFNLDIRQNNIIRTRFSAEFWPGYNNIGPVNNVNRIFVPSNSGVTQGNVFSILQLGDNLDNNLERDWMHKGITMGAGNDIFWSGIIQDPENDDNQNGGDAVIAWGDNEDPEDFGPDNFRFLFISNLTSASTGPNSDQGRETMRITPSGNVGIGDSFSNALQPSRRLVVHRQTNAPQFRIAWGLNEDPSLGQNADFQVTQFGVLHLKSRSDTTRRPVVVGFLPGEASNPTSFTTLDIGGITRIRDLREDSTKTCLILGTFADTLPNGDSADHYLTRLDFLGATDSVLSSAGTWVPLSGGLDCRWEDITSNTVEGEKDIRTGFDVGADCYRGKVAIGVELAKEAKLESHSSYMRDSVSTAILGEIRQVDNSDLENYSRGVFGRAFGSMQGSEVNQTFIGVEGRGGLSEPGRINVGVHGQGTSEQGGVGIGVYGIAFGSGQQIGVYAEADSSGYALYVVGPATNSQPSITLSDESIKTDIETLSNASELLLELQPRTYSYTTLENRPNALEGGLQYGFIAQEVQEVLPNIVKASTLPPPADSTGFSESEGMELLGIQYEK